MGDSSSRPSPDIGEVLPDRRLSFNLHFNMSKRANGGGVEGAVPGKRVRVKEEAVGGAAGGAGLPPVSPHYDEGYMRGFGGHFSTEALKGALPLRGNTPQKAPYGLYTEQLSGTAFTAPRSHNQRSWLYRIRPSVLHTKLEPVKAEDKAALLESEFSKLLADPNQMRWAPMPFPKDGETKDFEQGLITMAGAGDASMKSGLAIHVYSCNTSMDHKAFFNSDGDFLIVPQEGTLHIKTEFGLLHVDPREICVIQRGMKFSVDVDGPSRGYILEVFTGHFELPDLGPIGANGLANPRDFLTPVAAYEDVDEDYHLVNKYCGKLWSATMDHSPFDVVAWHGNYAPYKYGLDYFCCMNSVTFDHPDPSIYTVLTCKSDTPGVAVADFVIFPPRWMVMEDTFRPPYFHRNTMSEFMGMVYGNYDAKVGFVPGGASLHNVMEAHGPDAPTFAGASAADLKPDWFGGGLAFMFESTYFMKQTEWAEHAEHRETEYQKCWTGMPKLFDPADPSAGVGKAAKK